MQGEKNGASSYTLECQSDGTFTETVQRCRKVMQDKWKVEGFVKDATNTRPIGGAKIHVVMSSNSSVDVVTDASGKYVANNIIPGATTFTIEADGFVTTTNDLIVTGNMVGTRQTDFHLSPKAQAVDNWRLVLKWGEHPTDLDAYLETNGCKVYYGRKSTKCGGASVSLDTDDRSGFGPETITIKQATLAGSTLLFYVQLYSDSGYPPKSLQDSEANVVIYNGEGELRKIQVNTAGYIVGKKWMVARLDPQTGEASACTNAQCT